MSAEELRGRVLLLALRGELLPIWAEGTQGSKVRTVDAEGVQRVIAPARAYWVSERRMEGPDGLADYWREVDARAQACDLALAWRLLVEEGALEDADARDLAELIAEGATPEDVDGLTVAIFRDGLYFKVRKQRLQPTSPQAVEQALREREEAARLARELELAATVIAARLADHDEVEDPEALAAAERRIAALTDLAVFGADHADAPLAVPLLERLDRGGDPQRAAVAVLVELGEIAPHENLAIRKHGLKMRFSRDVTAAAEALAAEGPAPGEARDMTGLFTVAIDDAGTTEVDDAFAVDGDRLFVFIADVDAWLPWDSPPRVEASQRGTTVYLPEGKIRMLPPVLGEGAMSLVQGVERPALGFALRFEPNGAVRELEVFAARVKVDQQVTYDTADTLLEADEMDDVGELLHEAARLMDRHARWRLGRGALQFQRQEAYLEADPRSGAVRVLPSNPNGPGRQLVAELMVATCAATATYCESHSIPAIYRYQPSPDAPIELDSRVVEDPLEQMKVLRQLKRSGISVHAQPHYTLGVPAYTQVTSPIRRYGDMVMHHQLKGWLATGRAPLTSDELLAIFEDIERGQGAARAAEQEARRYWLLHYLAQRAGEVLEGLVLRPAGKRYVALIEDLATQEVFSPKGRHVDGDRVRLKIHRADPRADKLVLREV